MTNLDRYNQALAANQPIQAAKLALQFSAGCGSRSNAWAWADRAVAALNGIPKHQAITQAHRYAARYSIHSLRHMYAHNLYSAKNNDIRYVSARLGHKNVATTMKYLHSLEKPIDDYSAELALQLGLPFVAPVR